VALTNLSDKLKFVGRRNPKGAWPRDQAGRDLIDSKEVRQFAISQELRLPVAKEALVTELGALATGSKHSTVSTGFYAGKIVDLQVECRIPSLLYI
jgi:hypothetical protein